MYLKTVLLFSDSATESNLQQKRTWPKITIIPSNTTSGKKGKIPKNKVGGTLENCNQRGHKDSRHVEGKEE